MRFLSLASSLAALRKACSRSASTPKDSFPNGCSGPLQTSARRQGIRAGLALLTACVTFGTVSFAQTVQPRMGAIQTAQRATLTGSHPVAASAATDAGAIPGSTRLQGIQIVFSRSLAQETALQALIAAQQNPSSALYHQWLSPDQFAAQFGMADSDLAKVQSWLEQQGFTVNAISRSRTRITFSGTAAQVQAAFGAEIHNYVAGGVTHFAPSSDLTIPAAFAGSVQAVTNLSDFRPKSRVKFRPAATAQPNFTSSQSGSHFLTPKDVATIYDIKPAYSAGYTGANQSIAIMGQSFVYTSDITNFQNAAGLTPKAPTLVLVPNSGTATVYTGDESESDLDLEYSGGIATGANIFFVYTGNNANYGVFNSLEYAIDERIAPILSISYGECETSLGASNYATLNAVLAQAAAQGQSVITAAGDNGSTDCWDNGTFASDGLTAAQATALAVDFPSSSQYVTAMGGTEFPAADVAAGNTTYWSPEGSTDTISSALSYIPEQVWNDDSGAAGVTAAEALSAGGGGVSTLTPRPTWQTGVPGIPSGSYRLLPDIALAGSPNYPGYLYCSSDSGSTGISGSCSNGFRDANGVYLTIAGGTSFDAPIFAGMLALINQAKNSTGQGVANTTLYSLASNATTYASAFHDITSGTNACTAGTSFCTTAGASGYAAGTGYDEASGLGSLDLFNLLTAWPASTAVNASGLSSTTKLTPASTTPTAGANDIITFNVTATTSLTPTTPTGSLSVAVDGTTVNAALALSGGSATYTFSSTATGEHVITATYSGDGTFAPSTGTTTVNVGSSTTAAGSFTLTASNVSVALGASGVSTVTVTPAGGYTGTVVWSVSTASNLADSCYTINNLSVTGTAAVTTPLTLYTSTNSCATAASQPGTGLVKHGFVNRISATRSRPSPFGSAALGTAFAGFVFLGCLGRRRRGIKLALTCLLLGLVGVGLSGCSGSTLGNSITGNINQPAGTYTITLVGTDSATSTITASTSFTLTVQ